MSMLELGLAFTLAVAMCTLPGFVVGGALALDSNSRLALTPHVSLLLAITNGAACRSFNIRVDSLRSLIVFITITFIATVVARRCRPATSDKAREGIRFALTAAIVCFVAFMVACIRAIGSLSAWPQMPDSIFHVGAVTWMLRAGSAWLGDVPAYSELTDGPTAYPGAWHSLAVTLAAWSGASALEASQILALVVGGFVWPMGCVALVRRHVAQGPLPSAAAATAALTFFAMPYQEMAWGVLWPYLLGLSLLPGCLVAILNLQSLKRGMSSLSFISHVVLGSIAISAALLAHTAMLYVVALLGLPALALKLVANGGRRWGAITILCATAVTACLWILRPAQMVQNAADRQRAEIPELLVYSAGALSPQPTMAIVLTAGVAACLAFIAARTQHRWLLWGTLAPFALSAFVMWAPASVGSALSWPWWNEAARIRAVASTPIVLLIAAGAHEAAGRLARTPLAARALIVAVTVCLATVSLWVNAHHLRYTYEPVNHRAWWVTPAERTHLSELAHLVPVGATIAADPFAGGTHLYLGRDIHLLFPTEWSVDRNADKALLGRHLDSVQSYAAACDALQRLDVTHVVTGTRRTSWGDARADAYSALWRIDQGDGYAKLAVRGSFTLWRVPTCDYP